MSVINTNYLALVSQNNLVKSQNALGTAIERLSSGMRINSAKDDAAGQAIANRFTANIKGLTQAARNANDGISAAQTTEGALNEINNNLQRVRELSVQAANGSNSPSDLKSIQDEINQRMDEIDRVSKQTTFNGKNVLSENGKLTIQVGSLDSEVIDVNLRQINRETLGLSNLNMESQFVSKNAAGVDNFTPVTGTLNGLDTATSIPNTITPDLPAQWAAFNNPANHTFSGFSTGYTGFAVGTADNQLYVIGSDGAGGSAYFAASFDADTGEITVATASTALTASTVNTAATGFDPTAGGGGYVALSEISLTMIPTTDPTITNFHLENTSTATKIWAEIGGTFYGVTGNATTGFTIDGADSAAAQTGQVITSQTYLAAFGTPGVSLNYAAAATALGLPVGELAYVENEAGYQFVRHTDTSGTKTYYAAAFNSTTGVIAVTDGSNAVAVNTEPNMAAVNTALGGTDNVLVKYADKDGYYIQKGTGKDATYYEAAMSTGGTVTLGADAANPAATPAAAEIMVDPLKALDKALQQVDSLRSELGAVQNRFQSTIANLSNTVNNLSAARSRIEDADYAVEVSNMTRAQILQQAGTSVLAQANQVPQTVLSLLR